MPDGNGLDKTEATSASVRPLPGYTAFTIGGKEEHIPPLTFAVLETCKPELDTVDAKMSLYAYSDVVLKTIATSIEATKAGEDKDPDPKDIEVTFRRFKRRIIFGEMKNLGTKMDELYLASGFSPVGEAMAATGTEATNPGTGTLTESPQNSPSTESAEEIPPGSKESLH